MSLCNYMPSQISHSKGLSNHATCELLKSAYFGAVLLCMGVCNSLCLGSLMRVVMLTCPRSKSE